MTLVRWEPLVNRNPFVGLGILQHRMNKVFDELFSNDGHDRVNDWSPHVDVTELDNSFEVAAELPGLSKEDVKVEVQDNILSISGEKNANHEKKNRNLNISERCYGAFRRSFQLPSNVDATKINAEFTNGVLSITLPRVEEVKPKQIEVKVK